MAGHSQQRAHHRDVGPRVGASTLAALVLGSLVVGAVVTAMLAAWVQADLGPTATVRGDPPSDSLLAADDADRGYAVWEYNEDGRPVRWDPCSPVEIVVSSAGAPVSADAFVTDVEWAVAELHRATGLALDVTGTSTERPDASRSPIVSDADGDRWAPVLVGWVGTEENGLPLRHFDRGLGSPVAIGDPGRRVYVTGQVALNADRHDLEPGHEDRASSWGATILHELAHVLGLAHVSDPAQLLAVNPGSGPVELAPGDRAGLAAVGTEAGGCLAVPDPGPIQITTAIP